MSEETSSTLSTENSSPSVRTRSSSIRVDKEGPLKKQGKRGVSWKTRYFLLTGGSLHYYKTEMDPNPAETINLKGFTIETVAHVKKKNTFVLVSTIKENEKKKELIFAAKSTEELNSWLQAIQQALSKEACGAPRRELGEKKSLMFNAKKDITAMAVNSTIGKKIIKESTPEQTLIVLESYKKFVSLQFGKPKAKEIEKEIYRFAAYAATLHKEKILTPHDFNHCRKPVLYIWSSYLDFCEMKWSRDIPKLSKLVSNLSESLEQLFKLHFTPTNLTRMKEVLAFFGDSQTLEAIFKEEYDQLREEVSTALRQMWEIQLTPVERNAIQTELMEENKPQIVDNYTVAGTYMI